MDKTTGIRKETFMRLAKNLTVEQINNFRSLSPRLDVWGFEYFAANDLFDLENKDPAWSLIIESKLEFFRLHRQKGVGHRNSK